MRCSMRCSMKKIWSDISKYVSLCGLANKISSDDKNIRKKDLRNLVMGMLLSCLFSSNVYAQALALEPQNRFLAGYSYNDGNMGINVGFDSRLTQLIFINIGAFVSVSDREYKIDDDDASTWVSLSNGIFAAPGFRIPHRYKTANDALNWDIIMRTGFACVSSNNAYDANWFLVEPAAFGGADILVKKYNYGLSLSSKVFRYRVDISSIQESLYVTRPQVSASLFYQW